MKQQDELIAHLIKQNKMQQDTIDNCVARLRQQDDRMRAQDDRMSAIEARIRDLTH